MDGLRQQEGEQYCWEESDRVGLGGESAGAPMNKVGNKVEPSALELAGLVRTIEAHIIPRLLLAHRPPAARAGHADAPRLDDVVALASLAMAHEASAALSLVESLRARGTPLEAIYLELLAPAARHLGQLWEADLCSFTEVTLGLCRLQQVLNALTAELNGDPERPRHGRRALLVPAPGEQHTFGLSMVAEFLRRAGWDVWAEAASKQELIALVRAEWFAVIGFSVSCDTRLDVLAGAVRAIRRASRNPYLGVMVGGSVFVDHPELVSFVGADATAADARQACLQAETLLALPSRQALS